MASRDGTQAQGTSSVTRSFTAGALGVLHVKWEGGAVPSSSFTDPAGDLWTLAGYRNIGGSGDPGAAIFYRLSMSAASRTITPTFASGTASFKGVECESFTSSSGSWTTDVAFASEDEPSISGAHTYTMANKSVADNSVSIFAVSEFTNLGTLSNTGGSPAFDVSSGKNASATDCFLVWLIQATAATITPGARTTASSNAVKVFASFKEVASGGTHSTSGALTAGSAAIAGTATRLALHTTTGALSASAATISGVAQHRHAATGALSASAATIAGTATHLTLHTSSGALVAQAATIAGAAAHQHVATGALAAGAATIAGTADHTTAGASHAATGALTAGAATIAGSATHLTLHTTSGALTASAAAIAGTATHPHVATGALVSGSATVTGTAAHEHASTGVLAAQSATISGTAVHTAAGAHDSIGALQASSASIAGTALLVPFIPEVRGQDGASSPYRRWRYATNDEAVEETPTPAPRPPVEQAGVAPVAQPAAPAQPHRRAGQALEQLRALVEQTQRLRGEVRRQQEEYDARAQRAAEALAVAEQRAAEAIQAAETETEEDDRQAIESAMALLQPFL